MSGRPRATTVARRALCAGAVFTRGFIEHSIQRAGQDAAAWRERASEIGRWLVESDLLPGEVTGQEALLLAQPLGRWSPGQIDAVGWWSESIGVLLWALGLLDLPGYDSYIDATRFDSLLPLLGDAAGFAAGARLRPAPELDRELQVAALWQWRTGAGEEGGAGSLAAQTAAAAHAAGLLPPPIGGDLPALGRPYRELSGEQRTMLAGIARERSLTLSWLCGQAGSWSEGRL